MCSNCQKYLASESCPITCNSSCGNEPSESPVTVPSTEPSIAPSTEQSNIPSIFVSIDCSETNEDNFVVNDVPTIRTCRWLSRQNPDRVGRLCSKSLFYESYGPGTFDQIKSFFI